jgi:hypothetical protein
MSWAYEEYSEWARLLAKTTSVSDLEKTLKKLAKDSERLKASHLRAIHATSSMGGQSQRRAQSRSSLTANYQHRTAIEDALAIARAYPEHARNKEGDDQPQGENHG